MTHPLSGKSLVLYIVICVLIALLHATILQSLTDFTIQITLVDSFIYYLLLAGFGMGYYFFVKYFYHQGKFSIQEIGTHILGVILTVLLISYVHDALMGLAFNNEDYQEFLKYSFAWRSGIGTMLMMVLILIYYLYNHNLYIRAQQLKHLELQGMLRESEMEMLRFQINPHFIFNSLNSISALTMTSPETAQEMVIKLSEFFRNALGKERRDLHSVTEELRQMEIYLDMERIRFGDRLSVTYSIPEKCREHVIPALILQPLYENAIKHGVYEHLDQVEIHTDVSCSEGTLSIAISNTFDPLQIDRKRGTGTGLKNVRSRLELMYGIPDLVTIERTNSVYRVKILIPQSDVSGTDH